jgi:hypothetical protein
LPFKFGGYRRTRFDWSGEICQSPTQEAALECDARNYFFEHINECELLVKYIFYGLPFEGMVSGNIAKKLFQEK